MPAKDTNRILTRKDILTIPDEFLPAFVLSDNVFSLFSYLIKVHEHGLYNHFMIIRRAGFIISQDLILSEKPMETYLKDHHRLKIFINRKWTLTKRNDAHFALKQILSLPWYNRLYDWLQLIGFLLGARWFNIPFIKICSDLYGTMAKKIGEDAPYKPSPPELNAFFTSRDDFEVYGRFIVD